MEPVDAMAELRAWVGFTDADTARLQAFWPILEPEATAITDRFYGAILRFEGTRAVLADLAQVDRLKRTLVDWMRQLCAGPHDEAYRAWRERIGRMHVRVGLQSQYMLTAMNLLREDMIRLARAHLPDPEPTVASLLRITDIELAVMLGTYMESREEKGLADLREVIVSHLPMCVLVLDANGRVASTTAPSSRVFARSDVIGQPWDEVVDEDLIAAANLRDRVAHARDSGSEVVLPRVDVLRAGEAASYRITIAPLEHAMAALMIHVEDLTDVVAYEARARRAEHLARLGTLAASVAHEIRNPLAGISGAVQVIQGSMADGDARRAPLTKVQEQIARLGVLVGDLLMFSRPLHAAVKDSDLLALVRATTTGEEGVIAAGDGRALADPALFGHILTALLGNARQVGARKIEVIVDGAVVRVVDDGPGVPPELAERIFEPFFTTKTRGTGLGLPIARKMAEAMGGTLTLCASPLGGAGFALALRPPDEHGGGHGV